MTGAVEATAKPAVDEFESSERGMSIEFRASAALRSQPLPARASAH